MLSYVIHTIIDLFCLFLFMVGSYYTVIGFFSLFGRRINPKSNKINRFAVIIPAHNEADVIADAIASIHNTDYPQDKISIFVVADGCTDKTAGLAQKAGAIVVQKSDSTCKGDALNKGFSIISDYGLFDAVAVFDADNIVNNNFFFAMNERLNSGFECIQGYIDSKNPYESCTAYAHSMWYWITNRTMQSGRSVLGLGSKLCGTGFVITVQLLDSLKKSLGTFAEDAEYTCILDLEGVKIDFAENAVVYDEKPLTAIESFRQRKRWAKGVFDVQKMYTFSLLKRGHLNGVLNLWGDTLAPVAFVGLLLSALIFKNGIWSTILGKISLGLYVLLNVLITLLALVKDKKFEKGTITYFLSFIAYLLSWIPIGLANALSFGESKWYHTKHKTKK